MLTALKDLGSFLLSKNQKSTIDILLENPDSNGTYKVVWALEFDDQLTYKDVSVEELKDPKLYLYKRATGSNAPDFSPTSRVTEPSKTFTKKILQWFKNHTEITEIKKMYEELDANRDRILERLNELNAQTKDNKIITIKIGDKYLYEIDNPDFRKILRDDFLSKIQEISKANAQCSICGEKKDKVFTTSAIYKFYTLDKECYISGGFIKKEAWKNFPICEECFLQIDFAKKYVEEHLQFNFSGKTYYLIPKMVLKSAEAFDTLSEILEILTSEEKKQRLTNEQRKIITGDKNEILSILQDYNDVVSFYFLFLKRDHSAERILLLIEDVFPSRIHFIFDAKGKIDKIFRNNYTFAKLTQFLNEFDKLFFEVIDKIFRGGKLDFKILLQIFNRKIREAFLGDDDMKFFYIVTDFIVTNVKHNGERIYLADWCYDQTIVDNPEAISKRSTTQPFTIAAGDEISFFRELIWWNYFDDPLLYYALENWEFKVVMEDAESGEELTVLDHIAIEAQPEPGYPMIHTKYAPAAVVHYTVPQQFDGRTVLLRFVSNASYPISARFRRFDKMGIRFPKFRIQMDPSAALLAWKAGHWPPGAYDHKMHYVSYKDGAFCITPGISTQDLELFVYSTQGKKVFSKRVQPGEDVTFAPPYSGAYQVELRENHRILSFTTVQIAK